MRKRIGDTENTLANSGVNFDQVIYNALVEDGTLPAPAIRLAIDQARLESDNYSSNVFLINNNAFGYKYVAGADFQDGQGLLSLEGDYYANYDSVVDSAHELSAWWSRRATENGFDLSTLTSAKAYANALKSFKYYGSSPVAYRARMTAVDALVSVQADTGVNTQGTSLTTISVGAMGAFALVLYLLVRE